MPSAATASHAAAPRTVLVTGAGKRLGREIALTLAQAGWNVAVHHRHSAADAQQTAADCVARSGRAGSAQPFFADLGDEASVRALLPAVVAHFGAVDAVVNSASTFEHDSAATFGFAALEQHLRANTGAAVLLAQALHAHDEARDAEGAVVNLLDQKLWNMNPDFFSYTLSKAALEAANTRLALAL
ncbi:MAG: SDR family NAD(P)-dependent oxidoreductase, partial [Hydrogenophaga sp.]|nr:SDR family NAD(P)-dependent oxidoreductase [Hydrogenophaga sp.]